MHQIPKLRKFTENEPSDESGSSPPRLTTSKTFVLGILAAIAIQNYEKYQAMARQSEAKVQLAASFTSEKAFAGAYAGGGSPSLPTGANLPGAAGATGVTSNSFTVGAVREVSTTTSAYDLWTIDANKILVNTTPSL